MITLYGIPNCDTMKTARRWLDVHGIEYRFHNYKKAGIDRKTLKAWCEVFGYKNLVNRRGTTWRKLDEATRNGLDEKSAIDIMVEQPAIIKRPVLFSNTSQILGFNEADYESLL